jgi:hypothetical protein
LFAAVRGKFVAGRGKFAAGLGKFTTGRAKFAAWRGQFAAGGRQFLLPGAANWLWGGPDPPTCLAIGILFIGAHKDFGGSAEFHRYLWDLIQNLIGI